MMQTAGRAVRNVCRLDKGCQRVSVAAGAGRPPLPHTSTNSNDRQHDAATAAEFCWRCGGMGFLFFLQWRRQPGPQFAQAIWVYPFPTLQAAKPLESFYRSGKRGKFGDLRVLFTRVVLRVCPFVFFFLVQLSF